MTTKVSFTSTEGTMVQSFSFNWDDPRQALAHAESLRLLSGISDVSVVWDLLEQACDRMSKKLPG